MSSNVNPAGQSSSSSSSSAFSKLGYEPFIPESALKVSQKGTSHKRANLFSLFRKQSRFSTDEEDSKSRNRVTTLGGNADDNTLSSSSNSATDGDGNQLPLHPVAPSYRGIGLGTIGTNNAFGSLAKRDGFGWVSKLPQVTITLYPVVNFKARQRIRKFGAAITLGLDYLTDVQHWRTHCVVEDTRTGGRFSIRGSELGWTKAWLWGLGMGDEDSGAKFKLRLGLNLKTMKAYARLRFRTQPMTPFGLEIGEGISCAGKVPFPIGAFLPLFKHVPLRVEYKVRVSAPRAGVFVSTSTPAEVSIDRFTRPEYLDNRESVGKRRSCSHGYGISLKILGSIANTI